MSSRRPRPLLLLVIMLALTLLLQGVVFSFMYPRFPILAALLAAILGMSLAGAFLYVLPARGAGRLPMATLSVVMAMLVSFASVLLRALFLLAWWGHAFDLTRLASLRGWDRLQRELLRLPLCCGRNERRFDAFDHWLYLAAEQAAFLAGAVYVVVYLLRQGEPK